MAERAYTDFDIRLRSAGAGYEAHIESSAGSASSTFPLPFSERELDDFLSMFGGRRVRRMESPQLERARAFGGRLYQAVFDEELDALLAASLTEAGEAGNGLRIRIDLDEAPDLVNIPWEYLYRPASDDFLALSNWTPIVRYLDIETRMPPAPIEPPLSILVMISDPIEYQGSLDVEREWERLQESLADLVADGQVVLHRLERATERELLRELRRNNHHIFHFVGHGEFNEQEEDGVLLLEDEHRRTKLVTGRALGTVLRDARSLRLVVLNNCEGATASDTDPFSGAAQSLLQKGMPAVAAMQFEVTDNAAISFAHEFYAGLSDGYPADAALAEARKAIYQGATKYEFGSPVLYLSADDGVIFDIASRPPPPAGFDAELTLAEPHAEQLQPAQHEPVPGPEQPAVAPAEEPTVEPAAFAAPIAASQSQVAPPEETAAETPTQSVPTAPAPQPPEPPAPAVPAPPAVPPAETPTRELEPVSSEAPTREVATVAGDSGARPNRTGLYAVIASIAVLAVVAIAVLATRDGTTEPTVATTAVAGGQVTEAPVTVAPQTVAPDTTAANGGTVATGTGEPTISDPPTVAHFTNTALTIDGLQDDWASRFSYLSEHRVFGAANVSSLDDLAGLWQVAWDNDYLYLFADVLDDVIAQINTGAQLFRGDAVAIYFDGDLSDDAPGAQLNGDDFAFFFGAVPFENWVRLEPTSNGGGFGSDGALTSDEDLMVRTDMDFDDGYNVEVRIPWRLLGVTDPQPGQQFRMTLDVSDNDTPGASQQDAMISNSIGRTAEQQAFPEVWEMMVLGS